MTPEFSVILPAHNEEKNILKSLNDLISGLADHSFEVLVCENGSIDKTFSIVKEFVQHHESTKMFHLELPSYGDALKMGILNARGEKVIIFNVDFYDLKFCLKSLNLLNEFDYVIGSKNLLGSRDLRPPFRRFITKSFNLLLKIVFGFTGTDTHGIKALRKSVFLEIVTNCQTGNEIFDTEMILRAQKKGLKFTEIPMEIAEIRPSRYSLFSRFKNTFFDLITLMRVLK